MTKLTTTLVIALAAIGLSLGGCKKKEPDAGAGSGTAAVGSGTAGSGAGTAAGTGSAGSGAGTAAMGSGAGTAAGSGAGTATPDPVPAVAADYFKVVADHVDPAKGKVDVVFGKWTVTKAAFDPANLEGGTAELEVEVGSLSSGIADRDTHLATPDFLDATKFPKVVVKVDNVKKGATDKTYTADATVNLHGVEKKLPVTFDVVASTADSVTIKTNTTFSRKDFSVGGDGGPKDTVKFDLIVDAQLTLKKI